LDISPVLFASISVVKSKKYKKMAFASELQLERLEQTIAEFRRALAQPLLVPLRVIATDASGISTMELLQEDLPFTSPFFNKTKVFDHPNVLSVRFLTWPLPHFLITGTVEGVLSAMRRRYAFFILQHANALFKQESADSLIYRQPRPLQLSDDQLYFSLRDIPELEFVPRRPSTQPTLPPSRYQQPCANCDTDDWDSDPDTVDPIPTVNFRPYNSITDAHLYKPPTPPPMDDLPSTLPFIAEEEEDEEEPDCPMDLTTPIDPPTVIPEVHPDTPHDPPTPSRFRGLEAFHKIRQKFQLLFK
jgi:hypothetical protein